MASPHDPGVGPIPVEPPDLSDVQRAPCPRCGASTVPGVPACGSCGHAPSLDAGVGGLDSASPRRRTSGTCRGCGYSLVGLIGDTCPECGTSLARDRRVRSSDTSREVARQAYLHAASLAAGGLLLGVVVQAATSGWWAGLVFVGCYLLSAGIGIAVLLACGAMWVGFSSSVPLASLEVAATHAVALGVGLFVLAAFGVMAFALVAAVGLYLVLMEKFLDLEPFDARCVGALCLAAHVLAAGVARATGLI